MSRDRCDVTPPRLANDVRTRSRGRAGVFVVVPRGPKAFVWFTRSHGPPSALMWKDTATEGTVVRASRRRAIANPDLCSGKGTLLYGTMFMVGGIQCFSAEDIAMLRGEDVSARPFAGRAALLTATVVESTSTLPIAGQGLVAGLPLTATSHALAVDMAATVPYRVGAIVGYQGTSKSGPALIRRMDAQGASVVLKAVPTEIPDVYDLVARGGAHVGKALVSDVSTSSWLRRAAWKSVDFGILSDEVGDPAAAGTPVPVLCSYAHKFSKWVPERRAGDNEVASMAMVGAILKRCSNRK